MFKESYHLTISDNVLQFFFHASILFSFEVWKLFSTLFKVCIIFCMFACFVEKEWGFLNVFWFLSRSFMQLEIGVLKWITNNHEFRTSACRHCQPMTNYYHSMLCEMAFHMANELKRGKITIDKMFWTISTSIEVPISYRLVAHWQTM